MGYVGVSIIVVSLSCLLYCYPPATWKNLPVFARHSTSPKTAVQVNQGASTSTAEYDIKAQNSSPATTAPETDGTGDRQIATKSPQPIPASTVSDSRSSETTPKAVPEANGKLPEIPMISLGEDSEEDDTDNLPPPSFPALNSAQRASGPTLSPQNPTFQTNGMPQQRSASQLMPPPSKPVQRLNPTIAARNPGNSLTPSRLPTTGPLPNRGPPMSGGLAPLPSAPIKTPNPRGKVQLTPGHSPLDWANLQKSGKNLAGVDRLIRVTPSMLKQNNGRKGKPAWSSWQGKVYNIGPYLPYHPGGAGELMRGAGKDGAKLFMEVHPWVNWENMLGECLVGIMVSESEAENLSSNLEDMD